jgi:hypothetical protein
VTFIVVDTDGQLHVRDATATSRAVTAEVGPEGWALVHLRSALGMFNGLMGWANDCGHLFPEKYPRNVVGSCLLVTMGASGQPYAGPIVVTGWDADSDGPEIRDLTEAQTQLVTGVHGDVQRALAGWGTVGMLAGPMADEWAQSMRDLAEQVRTAPTPTMTFLADEDAIEHLRRMGR